MAIGASGGQALAGESRILRQRAKGKDQQDQQY
jgi:uncharacterized protein YoaH (UPF0181 family)